MKRIQGKARGQMAVMLGSDRTSNTRKEPAPKRLAGHNIVGAVPGI